LTTDLTREGTLPRAFDALVHCAAEIPARCPDGAVLYKANVDAAHHVFRQACEAKASTVIFLSSMSVYGQISSQVVTESTRPTDPDAYGQSKLAAEQLLAGLVGKGLKCGLSIRLPGTVGKGSHHNFLSDTLARILNGEDVQARNPQALFNNIVYVGDLARFLLDHINHPASGYKVTNLAASDPISIGEVVHELFKHSGREERVRFLSGGKMPFLIDLANAVTLGFRPATVSASLEAFVRDTLAAP
jgi:nucleoside-diphosphate-sugar epimerase